MLLVAASVWIVWEAVDRFSDPHSVDGVGVAVVGALALIVNGGSAYAVGRVSGENLNLRGAFLHLVSDTVGSLGVVVAGVVVATTDAEWADPAISLAITALVLVATWGLLRDATSVLLERAPRGVDATVIETALRANPTSRPSTTSTSGPSDPRAPRSRSTWCSPASRHSTTRSSSATACETS
jgi:cobalt-zinc-cadmium efflux system protein